MIQNFYYFGLISILFCHFIGPDFNDNQSAEKEGKSQQNG